MSELWEACELEASYRMFGGGRHNGTRRTEDARRKWLAQYLVERCRLRTLIAALRRGAGS